MRNALIYVSIASLSLAGTAVAAESSFDYSYVELGYVNTDLDDFNADGDGFELRGSLEVNSNVHVFARYTDLDYDFNIDTNTAEVGGGYAWPVRSNMDIIGTVSYLKAEVDVPGAGNFDDDALGLGVGLRGRALDQLELTAGLQHIDFDEAGDDTIFGVGGRYFFTPEFAAGIDATFDDDGTAWYLGGRWSFGQ